MHQPWALHTCIHFDRRYDRESQGSNKFFTHVVKIGVFCRHQWSGRWEP